MASVPPTSPAPYQPKHWHLPIWIAVFVAAVFIGGTTFLLLRNSSTSVSQDTDDQTTTLSGNIILEQHFGPPGFGENPDVDEKENVPILQTSAGNYQLVFSSDMNIDDYVGKNVIAEGELFDAMTGENFTPQLLQVSSIQIVATTTSQDITPDQAVELVKNLSDVKGFIASFCANPDTDPDDGCSQTDSESEGYPVVALLDSDDSNSYLVRVYREFSDGHTSTYNLYTVDLKTGEVKTFKK